MIMTARLSDGRVVDLEKMERAVEKIIYIKHILTFTEPGCMYPIAYVNVCEDELKAYNKLNEDHVKFI